MRRGFLPTILLIGAAVGTALAQQPPPTPSTADSTNKPRARSVMTEEQRAQQEQRLNESWAKMPVESKSRFRPMNANLCTTASNAS